VVRAFNLADKYQIPVIVLTDQFLADAHFSLKNPDLEDLAPHFVLTDPSRTETYRRYALTDSGISPRLYPGQSEHPVCADSDEHDEAGHITEDLGGIATAMMKKRMTKLARLKQEISRPEEVNLERANTVFVGWGSSRGAILEAMENIEKEGQSVGMIHFTELWPLPGYTFPPGKIYWTVESNILGQLARLLRSEYGLQFEGTLSRYDGLPLTGDSIRRQFRDQS
jgi:2-oxoglutarate ferredoxin oxidoreductase subunit alpha